MDRYEIIYCFNGIKNIYFVDIMKNQYLNSNDVIHSLKFELYKFLGTSEGVSIISIKPCKAI